MFQNLTNQFNISKCKSVLEIRIDILMLQHGDGPIQPLFGWMHQLNEFRLILAHQLVILTSNNNNPQHVSAYRSFESLFHPTAIAILQPKLNHVLANLC